MENMKHIQDLVKNLTNEEVGYLLYQLKCHEKVFIPQWYDSEMAQGYGYRDAGHMMEVCEEVYQDIDEIISTYYCAEDDEEENEE
jgi:hypothetical protein